jgi:two-component system, LytTR family, response regulator
MTTPLTLTTIVAEDEPLAAQGLAKWVSEHERLTLVKVCSDGRSALDAAVELKPQLLLLDINMPGQSGLEVAKALAGQSTIPAIVFTTAYDEFAVTAFELQAIDYLLKPFSHDRFLQAIDNVLKLGEPSFDRAQSYNKLDLAKEPLKRIMIRDQGKIFPISVDSIQYFKSDSKYTAVAYKGRQFLVRVALHHIEPQLDPSLFIKLQRSCIVNLDYVESMTPDEMSQLVVKMQDGSEFTASREVSKILRNQSI